MQRLVTILGVATAFAALGLANRWDTSRPIDDAAAVQARLLAIPMEFGDWIGSDNAIDPGHLRVSEATAHLSRSYRHARSGVVVNVLVLHGEPGPLGAHTPDVCYRSAGFRQITREFRRTIGSSSDEVWSARFDGPGVPATSLQVSWAWTKGDRWIAAGNPRVEFAGGSQIFKLYLARSISPAADQSFDSDDDFASNLFAEFRKCASVDASLRVARMAPVNQGP